MITISATEAHKHLGQHLSQAQIEPIKVTRPGQKPVIIVSESEYETCRNHYDAYCYALAMESRKNGYATQEEVAAFVKRVNND